MPLIVTQEGDLRFLNAGLKPTLDTLRLYKNPVVATPITQIDELEEADFTGYDGFRNIVWFDAFINPLGKGQALAPSEQWLSIDAFTTANMIYGVYYTGDNDELTAIEPFPAPINVDRAGVQVFYQPSITCVTEVPPS